MGSYDFSGWATRNDLLCADGRTIRRNAFAVNDGKEVPLVWNHQHNDIDNVLGHALLENRDEGVYAYCTFNNSPSGMSAREAVTNGDVKSLSIYANNLKQSSAGDVFHGVIRELSLVLAGANPGAYIDTVIAHSDDGMDEGVNVNYANSEIELYHSDESAEDEPQETDGTLQHAEEEKKEEPKMGGDKEKTVQDVIDSMNEEQKTVLYAMVGEALESNKGEDEDMKHNIFDNDEQQGAQNVLTHSMEQAIINDGKRFGSLKDSFLAHAEEGTVVPYGIQDPDMLFPDAKNLNTPPEFIGREMDWVNVVMAGTHHTPFSRVKSMFADITEDAARAKGYIKGKLKKEEVFSLLKRSTSPTTIYKKQKMDRDDVIDITDFDVIAWIKGEMRMMLNEEIARAILLGDGRLASDDDHINTDNIRPIVDDADLFVIRWAVAGTDDAAKAKNFIKAAIKARKNYRGSGNPVMFTTEDMLTEMLLLEDGIGHRLYKTEAELATTLRVSKIVTVPVMENAKDKDNKDVLAIIVNLSDYNVGADKGGAVNMFDDFDIDYNQQKYLIETRCSGALIKPFSAIVLRSGSTTASEEPTMADAMKPFKKEVAPETPDDQE